MYYRLSLLMLSYKNNYINIELITNNITIINLIEPHSNRHIAEISYVLF